MSQELSGNSSDSSEFVLIEHSALGSPVSSTSDESDRFAAWNISPSNISSNPSTFTSSTRPLIPHREGQFQARRPPREDRDDLDSLIFPSPYTTGALTPPRPRTPGGSLPNSRPSSPAQYPPSQTSSPSFSPKPRAPNPPAFPPTIPSPSINLLSQDVFRSHQETTLDQVFEAGSAAISEAATITIAAVSKAAHWVATRDPSQLWLTAYFAASVSLTISNKYLLRGWFPFPWILTTVQLSFALLGTQLSARLGLYRVARLSAQRELIIYSTATLFSCEILLSNVSLKLVTLPYHLSVRALSPLVVLLVSVFFFQQPATLRTTSTLLIVLLGVIFTSIGLDLDSLGSLLTIFSMIFLSAKTLITKRILFDKYKLHPLDLLARVAPLGMAHSAIFAVVNGELSRLWSLPSDMVTKKHVTILLANGVISFLFVVLGLLVEKRTRGAAMAITSHAAQAFTIVVSVILFKLALTATNFFGVVLTLGGGILYARTEALDTELDQQTPLMSQMENGKGKILPD